MTYWSGRQARTPGSKRNSLARSSCLPVDTRRIRMVAWCQPVSKMSEPEFRFEPGVLAWRPDQYGSRSSLVSGAQLARSPFPRSWEADLGDGRRLTVLGYYPHARREEYSPSKSSRGGVPAVKIRLRSSVFGRVPREPWLALIPGDEQTTDLGPAMIEMLGRCPTELLNEFLNPPSAKELGAEGQLVLALDGKVHRFRVDRSRGRSVEAGGYALNITRYKPGGEGSTPTYPALEFDLTKGGKTTHYITLARYAGVAVPMEDGRPVAGDPNNVHVWYHPPDYSYGHRSQAAGCSSSVSEPGRPALLPIVH